VFAVQAAAQRHTLSSPLVTYEAASRFLEQASWGPVPASIAEVQEVGMEAYLEGQFNAPPSAIATIPAGSTSFLPLQQGFFYNARYGQDQLRQRVAFALSEIWVVSVSKINTGQALGPYLQLLANDAFSNYLTIMTDVTLSPAMGHYLDMVNNNKPTATQSANENYAREMMQLFTLGLVKLNPDGTPMAGAPPPFTETDVQNFARVYTGWTYPTAPGATLEKNNPAYWVGPMVAVESNHDTGSKTLLGGVVLPAGQTAEEDLSDAMLNIFNQPNVGPFVSKQLIQHLVTSNPSPAYVSRVATIFNNNGQGVRGDMKAVISAILLDSEARAGDVDAEPATGGHLREPVLFVNALMRALGATITSSNTLVNNATNLGQTVYDAPSVFNYFSPGYRVSGGLLGPEFQLLSPSTAMLSADFVNTLAFGSLGGGTVINLAPYTALAAKPQSVIDALNEALFGGRMPQDMQNTILVAMGAATTTTAKVQTALYLAASSWQYLVEQ
jgi:uncharacterized protein (DUF1800 family)